MTDASARPSAPAGRPPDGAASDPRARPDLALLARPVVDLRRARARSCRSRLEFTGLVDKDEAGTRRCSWSRSAARSSPSSSSRPSARSPTTRSRAGAGASRTSSSARSSTWSSSSGSRRRTRCSPIAAFVALLQFSSNFAQGPFQGYVPGPRPGAAGRPGQRAGRADAGPRQRRRASSSAALAIATDDFALGRRSRSASSSSLTMLSVVIRVREGRVAEGRATAGRGGRSPPRRGARTSCGAQLRVAGRLAPRHPDGGGAVLIDLAVFYLERVAGPERAGRPGNVCIPLVGLVALGTVDRGRPGRAALGPGRAQAGHLGELRARARRAGDRAPSRRRSRSRSSARSSSASSAGHLPRGRLGADDRHHPEGLVGPVHGPLERRDGVGRRARGRHRRHAHGPRRRAGGPARGPRSWLAVGLFGVGALLLRPVDERRREDDAARRSRRRGAGEPRRPALGARPTAARPQARRARRPSQRRQVAGRRKSNGSGRR